MKIITILILLLFVSCTKTKQANVENQSENSPQGTKTNITTDEIRKSEIIGAIGVPIGECVKIKGTIVKPDEQKVTFGYYLNVTQVNGNDLNEPVLYKFIIGHATENVKLATEELDLYKLIHGKKAESLNLKQIAELEKNYVGKEVYVLAYESGYYSGMPKKLPKGFPLWQAEGHYFRSHLIILDQYQ